jgi:hypothetical protein
MAVAIADLTQMHPSQVPREHRPFEARGAALKAWRSGRREVLLSGPAGTGKSRGILQKLHHCATKYPGMRGLIVRKTRESITQTAMVTYEQKVLPQGWLGDLVVWRTTEQEYRYANGSIIAVGGLDKASKVMSSEWDMIVVLEATELEESDWEALTTRLRNGVMPYQQLLGDCNPSYPTHWLKRRCDRGDCLMLHSLHRDNPTVKRAYLKALQALTGVRLKRLYEGVWAAAEGLVYEEWNPAVHLMDRFEIPESWSRYWVIDWGFRHPFVLQFWAENHDGELFRYREIYTTGKIVEDLAKDAMTLSAGEPPPRAIICDHDIEDRMTFERHTGYETIAADKPIRAGIQDTKALLRPGNNSRPVLRFLRDSLVNRDPTLEDKALPACTDEEFDAYEWDTSNGRRKGEEPVDKDNHGMDCVRYLCRFKAAGVGLEPLNSDLATAIREYRGY